MVTLTIVAFATYNLISKGGVNEACKVLLQVEDYEIKKKSNKTYKVVSQVYWLLAVAIYLGYSFITNNWHISWIIWPVASTIRSNKNNYIEISKGTVLLLGLCLCQAEQKNRPLCLASMHYLIYFLIIFGIGQKSK